MSYIKSRKHQPVAAGTAFAAFATLAMPLALHAQTAGQAQQMPEVKITGGAERTLQAPVKSASNKLTAPLLDTPKSITVITADVISQTGAVSLTDALRTVPGITVGAAEGGNPVGDNLFIRGYNAQTDTYIDGIRDTGSQSREIFALEQIEVVKGPNSAYGGRSSAGGSVNLISKTPKADNFINASVGLGSAQYRRATVDVNRSIDDNVAVRLNVMGHDAHVAGRDFVNGKRWGVAPSVSFGMQSPTKVTLSYYHMESSELPDTGLPFNNPFATVGTNTAKRADIALNGNGTPVSVPRSTFYGLTKRDFRDTQSDIGTIDVRHEFGAGLVLRNVTRYGSTGNDYVYTQPDDSKGNTVKYGTVWRRANSRNVTVDGLANATSLSGEFKAAGVKHSFTTGVELSREESDRTSYLFAPGTNNPLTNSFTCPTSGAATLYNCAPLLNPNANDPWVYSRSESPSRTNVVTNTRSVYAFDTVEFNPQWLLNVGVRWDGYRSALTVPYSVVGTTTTQAGRADVHSNFASYQAGLVYKPAANSSVYLSYGTSSTPVGNDGGDGNDAVTAALKNLKPQDSRNFELGTKWEIMARRLSVSAAYFRSEMNNARTTAPDGQQQNVGKKNVNGVEFGVSGSLSNNWQVFGGYTHLNAVIGDNGYLNTGTTAAPVYTKSPFDGNRFPGTPKDSASLWTSYLVLPGLTVGGGVNYVSQVFGNINNNKSVPGYTRVDAMASYVVNKNVTMRLNVQNLGDKLYFDKVSSPHYAGVAAGRSATLTANLKF
ncbi:MULTISPECIES: TonB-dependent receptor [unclassified Janthinobacterium]|uniref:TonB-dependent receptor n=1 Tax=unclassified Janthinobacterium TaxID=2610881 RepID=UPI00034DC193|nr:MULTISPECIES: TonB-dependent siderophore receptor [unclassified Janthinobacterium]MEC5162448.1 catecholate siderophore receptor [Janthinobacterium sp. CG_S6]